MSLKNFEPGDVNIVSITLSKNTPGATKIIDIRPQVISMSIYEDIEEPTMLVELMLADSLNLVQDYPIIGEEMIVVSFHTPGRDKLTKKGFMIYSIEGTGTSPSTKASIYTIKAVTPLHYFNASSLIEKSYKDTVDEIVKDIVKISSQASPTEPIKLFAEKTKGILPITIPRLNPFKAIDLLRQKAVSAEVPSGGAFVFFENQYGHQFRSIEGILKEGKQQVDTKIFTYAPNVSSDKERAQYALRNIIRYNHLSKFDNIEKLLDGVVINTVESFDILKKESEVLSFKLAEKAKMLTSTENKSKLPNSNEFIEKYTYAAAKKFFMSKDSSRGDDFIDQSMGIRQAFSSLINQNVVRVLVHGDSFIAAGDVVELNLPETSGTTEVKTKDRLNSGNYLITKLRHIITMEEGGKPKHSISFDCSRIGYK